METTSSMTQGEHLLIRSERQLIRFRLVSTPRGVELICAVDSNPKRGDQASDPDATGVRWLTFEILQEGRASKLTQNVWVEDQGFKDFDVAIKEAECVWVIEQNSPRGAVLANIAPWSEMDRRSPPLTKGRTLRVEVPVARSGQVKVENPWNAALAPHKWLFNPRVFRTFEGPGLITCNTASGDLLELRGPTAEAGTPAGGSVQRDRGQHWEEVRFQPEKLFPVIIPGQDRELTVFLQAPLNDNFFWSLRRYSGRDRLGNLMLEGDGVPLANLSTLCGLDSVRAFDMDSPDGKRIAIAAIYQKDGKILLGVLRSIDGGRTWTKLASVPLQGEANQVSLRTVTNNLLYVAYSLVEGDFSIIKLVTLPWRN